MLNELTFDNNIWEPTVGGGHLAKVLQDKGFTVFCSDIVDRGYPNTNIINFLEFKGKTNGDIIMNPPYKYALEFCEKGVEVINVGHKLAALLKLTFLEGKKRRFFFEENPPKIVYVFSGRTNCAKNGDFEKNPSSAVCYAWFIWEKGFKGDPIVKWIN